MQRIGCELIMPSVNFVYSETFRACSEAMQKAQQGAQRGNKVRFHKTRHVLQAILVSFLLAIPGVPAARGSGGFLLAGVSVEGSKRYKSSEIAPVTGLTPSSGVTFADLKKAADRLASAGVFADVTYRYTTLGNTMTVTFLVQDANDLLRCRFGNFVWFTQQELMQDLRSHVPLFQGYVPPSGKMLGQVETQLQDMLVARGIHAQIQYAAQQIGGSVHGIEFMEVGVALPIKKVEFSGVKGMDVSLLQQAADPLLNQNYDASFVHSFSQGALRRVYRRHGYLLAKFGAPVPHLLSGNAASDAVEVTIPVSEGEQYDLKAIKWSGQSTIPYTKLAKMLHLPVGRPVNAVKLNEEVLGMLPLYHNRGYFVANVTPMAVLDTKTHTAVYQIQIHQGALYRMGALEIAGVDASHARSIERLCRLRRGDPYRADYWKKFLKRAFHHLPPSSSGWRVRTVQKVQDNTKTVNVRLIFSPEASI